MCTDQTVSSQSTKPIKTIFKQDASAIPEKDSCKLMIHTWLQKICTKYLHSWHFNPHSHSPIPIPMCTDQTVSSQSTKPIKTIFKQDASAIPEKDSCKLMIHTWLQKIYTKYLHSWHFNPHSHSPIPIPMCTDQTVSSQSTKPIKTIFKQDASAIPEKDSCKLMIHTWLQKIYTKYLHSCIKISNSLTFRPSFTFSHSHTNVHRSNSEFLVQLQMYPMRINIHSYVEYFHPYRLVLTENVTEVSTIGCLQGHTG